MKKSYLLDFCTQIKSNKDNIHSLHNVTAQISIEGLYE